MSKRVVAIKIVKEGNLDTASFLKFRVLHLQNQYADGSLSPIYKSEFIDRKGVDCVAVALYYSNSNQVLMGIRRGIRPAVYFRKEHKIPISDNGDNLYLYEALAGSIESSENGIKGITKRVIAEVKEEGGFNISAGNIISLGAGFFPSHGQSSEKVHLFAVLVDPEKKGDAEGDGSVIESDSLPLEFIRLHDIFRLCREGKIADPKIEILALRLAFYLNLFPQVAKEGKN